MTTPHDPRELASALVDGTIDGDEAERAAADPQVAARVEDIRRMQHALREVPPPPDIAKARALAAAVDAGMEAHGRANQPSGRGARGPWLAAAAVLAVVALAVGVLTQRGDDDADVTASADSEGTAEDRGAAADEDPAAGEADRPGDAGAAQDTMGDAETREQDEGLEEDPSVDDDGERSSVIDLGTFTNEDDLVAGVAAQAGADQPAQAPSSQPSGEGNAPAAVEEQAEPCPQRSATGDPERGTSTFAGTATLAGEPVWVHLYPSTADRARLTATTSDCVDVVDRVVRTGS